MSLSKRRYKGHCGVEAMMSGRVRGQGWAERLRPPELRFMGKKRRVGRHEIPADQRDPG